MCGVRCAVCCHRQRQCRMEYVMRHESQQLQRKARRTNKKRIEVFYSKIIFQGYYENHVLHTRTADGAALSGEQ